MAATYLAKFLFGNKILRATTILATNVATSLPLANLKLPQRQRVVQFDVTAGAQIQIDFGTAQQVNMVAYAGSNLRTGAFAHISYHTVNDFNTSTALPSITHVRPVQVPGGLALDCVNFAVFDTVTARYWWIVLDDSGNPDGYLRLGVLALGTSAEYDPNLSRDIQIGVEPRGRVERTASGTPVSDRLLDPMQLSLTYDGMTSAQTWASFVTQLRQMKGQEIFVVPFPLATGAEKNETAIYGACVSLPTVTLRAKGPIWTVGRVVITESL